MSSLLSNENDSLLQSFDIIRISPSPEDDEKYKTANSSSILDNSIISVDAQSINNVDSMLSNHTPQHSLPNASATSSFVSSISQESVIMNNNNSIKSMEPSSISKLDSIRSGKGNSILKTSIGPEVQRSSLTNSGNISSLNDIGPGIIMGNMQISEIADYSYISEPKSDNSKILELQARFRNTEEILKRNNIKLRQQYAKLQKFQNEVQEAAELSTKHIEDRNREIASLKATINDLEIKLENLKAQNDWSQENFRVNLNFLETENFEFKKTISEKLAVISNMSAEMKKLQDQNIYLATNSKNNGPINIAPTASIPLNEHKAILKDLERNNSALLAENLTLKDSMIKFQNEIHARTVHLAEVQEQSRYRITEIERVNADLTNEKKKTRELNDRVGVLEIYLNDCKSDFERERQERAAIAGSREQLMTELKISQKRNQQLLEELKKHTDAATSKNKASPPKTMPKDKDFQFTSQPSFICPICSRNFTNYVALANHVQQCLE